MKNNYRQFSRTGYEYKDDVYREYSRRPGVVYVRCYEFLCKGRGVIKNDIFRETSDHDENCKGPSRKRKNIIELRDDDNYDLDKAEGKIDTDDDNDVESMIGGAKEESSIDTTENSDETDAESTTEEDSDDREEEEEDEDEEVEEEEEEDEKDEDSQDEKEDTSEEDSKGEEEEEEYMSEEDEETENEEQEEDEEEDETESESKTIRIHKTYIWSNY